MSPEELIRLECLKIANARPHLGAEEIINGARAFEAYVRGDEREDAQEGHAESAEADTPPKRGRGRPKKQPAEPAPASE